MFALRLESQGNIFQVEIEPLDHPAVVSWVEHFVDNTTVYQATFVDALDNILWNRDLVNQHLDTIRERVGVLSAQYGITFANHIPTDGRQLNREFTNRCHRFFTENQKTVNQASIDEDQRVLISALLSDINHTIHLLELYLPPIRNAGFYSINEVHIEFDSKKNQWQNPRWWQMEPSWRELHTDENQHYDVILTSEILGKTILRSYLDDDDPHHWDTSGHYSSLGGLQIQFEPTRREVYRSQDFVNWYGPRNGRIYFDYPIGMIKDKNKLEGLKYWLSSTRGISKSVSVSYVAVNG